MNRAVVNPIRVGKDCATCLHAGVCSDRRPRKDVPTPQVVMVLVIAHLCNGGFSRSLTVVGLLWGAITKRVNPGL